MSKSILVVGSINMDYVTEVASIPKVGETILGSAPQFHPGGKGANQAVAMARLDADVTMFGAVGQDVYGERLIKQLVDSKVKLAVKTVRDQPTGTAIIMLEESRDNAIVVIRGANQCIQPEEISEKLINDFDIVVLQMEIEEKTVIHTIEVAHKMGKYVVLNLAPARKIPNELLAKIDLLILNESEYGILFNSEDYTESMIRSLNTRYDIGGMLITRGSKGAIFVDGDCFIEESALTVEVVDTTGAGDAFVGGIVSQIALDQPMSRAMKYATKVASIAVTKLGAQSSLPFRGEVIL